MPCVSEAHTPLAFGWPGRRPGAFREVHTSRVVVPALWQMPHYLAFASRQVRQTPTFTSSRQRASPRSSPDSPWLARPAAQTPPLSKERTRTGVTGNALSTAAVASLASSSPLLAYSSSPASGSVGWSLEHPFRQSRQRQRARRPPPLVYPAGCPFTTL